MSIEIKFQPVKLSPPYERLCVVDIKNHRYEFGTLHDNGQWEIYGDGAGLEGDIIGWALLPK